jgi:hypothetical protein
MLSCLAISVQGCHGAEPPVILLDCRCIISFPAGSGEEYVGEGNSGVLHGVVHLFARESVGFPRPHATRKAQTDVLDHGRLWLFDILRTDRNRYGA